MNFEHILNSFYLGQLNELLSRDGEELEVSSMGQNISHKVLDVAGVALDLVQISKLLLLVLQHLECLLQPALEDGALASELGQLLMSSGQTLDKLVRVLGHVVISVLQLLAIGLQLVEFRSAKDISTSLNQLSNDVKSIVNWTVVVINIILDLSESIDLVLESVNVLLRHILTGDLPLNLVQPLVEVINVLRGLSELLLDGFLHRNIMLDQTSNIKQISILAK